MSRLMDVCGLVDYNTETKQHNRTKSIYGSVLVDDQSDYFEGFVRTYDEKKSYLVFGTFNAEEGFHMYSCNEEMGKPVEIVKNASFQSQVGTGYNDLKFAEYTSPEVKIIVQDGDVFRDVTTAEMTILQAKIDTIMRNIENYDGTANGQEDVTRG